MKNLILLLTLVIMSNLLRSQTESADKSFQYLTGSDKTNGYEYKICTFRPIAKQINFKNGKIAPILQVYVIDKKKYIGGILENESGKKTIIKDIILIEKDTTLIFTVIGIEFSRGFDLNSGVILKEESFSTTFYTDDIGIWKIVKNK